MIRSLQNKYYEGRLASLNLFSLEKRPLRGKLIECFKILKGFTNVDASKLFSIDGTSRTRSNGVKLRCKQVRLNSTKFFFTNDVVREWNKLPPSVVQCYTINSFRNKLDHHFLNQGIRYRVNYLTYRRLFDHVSLDYVCVQCVNSYLACFRKLLLRLRLDRLAWTLASVWYDILCNSM